MTTTLQVIHKTREYLDYIEGHILNINNAHEYISNTCKDTIDISWEQLAEDVKVHDMSKLTKEEFVQYRESFYGVDGNVTKLDDNAWENHKQCNSHHHETIMNTVYDSTRDRRKDLTHMVIDWTAMSYKFGGSAEQYYNDNADKIILLPADIEFINDVFVKIKK